MMLRRKWISGRATFSKSPIGSTSDGGDEGQPPTIQFSLYASISSMFRGYKKNSLVVLRIHKDIVELVGLVKRMNNVNKTLYIPLYGKAFVSKRGIILNDLKAEEIWNAEGFKLKGKAKSKWLAYYMGMRSAVFDQWLKEKMKYDKDSIIIHIGCGMDSRIERVGTMHHSWYDVDFPNVIQQRKRYFCEFDKYHMLEADVRQNNWIKPLPKGRSVIIVMEGVSMYFRVEELKQLLENVRSHFDQIAVLMDCYTVFAAKVSKYKNPINNVGVTIVHGINNPKILEENTCIAFVKEHNMTPDPLINELKGIERIVFKKIFGGSFSKRVYRLYEYQSV